jgi:hypothetical protein
MLSITVRHHAGDDLKALRQGVSKAWRKLQQTRDWRDMRDECGIEHFIRGHDITWGENGWHPHIHVLMFCTRPALAKTWRERMTALWRAQVVRSLGASHLPTKRRALSIDVCHDASYIARLGLEIASPAAKHARDGHLAPMQLAELLANATGPKRERLAQAWRTYADGMKGCHQLQWSTGLRAVVGEHPSDEQIVVSEHDAPPRLVVGEIPQETWREMALRWGVHALDDLASECQGATLDVARASLLHYFEVLEDATCVWDVHRETVTVQAKRGEVSGTIETHRLRWLC